MFNFANRFNKKYYSAQEIREIVLNANKLPKTSNIKKFEMFIYC